MVSGDMLAGIERLILSDDTRHGIPSPIIERAKLTVHRCAPVPADARVHGLSHSTTVAATTEAHQVHRQLYQ
jgi:hypothetical protein